MKNRDKKKVKRECGKDRVPQESSSVVEYEPQRQTERRVGCAFWGRGGVCGGAEEQDVSHSRK